MKISYWIPNKEDPNKINKFINNEIAEAKNIKSKQTRKETETALTLLKWNFAMYGTGYCYYSDENYLTADKYDGNVKRYNCGKGHIKPASPDKFV